MERQDFFGPKEYSLGGSAFNNSEVMVSSYKKAAGCPSLPAGRWFFNDLVVKPHSKVENTIGIYKGHFPYFRNICVKVKGRCSMQHIIRYCKACAILHNLLIDHNIPEEWIVLEDEDDEEYEDAEGMLGDVTPENSRRNQVHNYLDMKLN